MQRFRGTPQSESRESDKKPFIKKYFITLNTPNAEERIKRKDEGGGKEDVLSQGHKD